MPKKNPPSNKRTKKPTKKPTKKRDTKKRDTKKRATNPWLEHVKKVKAANKDMAFKDVLKLAGKNYKKA